MAALLALFLTASAAEAGTWQLTSGPTYNCTVTVTGNLGQPVPTPTNGQANVLPINQGQNQPGGTAKNSGTATMIYTWVPTTGMNDPAPPMVWVQDTVTESAYVFTMYGTAPGTGTPAMPVTITTNHAVTVINNTVTITSSQMSASYIATSTSGKPTIELYLTYNTYIYPTLINLPGTTPDANGNLHILIGQQCQAGFAGFNVPFNWLSNIQWSVGGQSVQANSWNVATGDTSATFSGTVNPYTYTQAKFSSAPPVWYWDDVAGLKTISCTATVTPPTGQGTPFNMTLTQAVTVDVPAYTPLEPVGVVQLNTKFPGAPGSPTLYAGPGLNNTPIAGIVFNDTVTTPSTAPYSGTGYWYHIQIATESRFRTPVGSSTPIGSVNNGGAGLDYASLQGGGVSYVYGVTPNADGKPAQSPDNDNPSLPVEIGYKEYNVKNESFQDYIMYSPPGTNSISVPLASFTWSWNVDVKTPPSWATWNNAATGGTITPPATVSRQTSFPVWTKLANPAW